MAKKTTPAEIKNSSVVQEKSSRADIANFLEKAATIDTDSQGRLIFSLDATMSRQPTWDRATQIQSSMFEAAGKASGLSVQLIYFRGFGECRASRWVTNTGALANLMTSIQCKGGTTQIAKILRHASKESKQKKVSALVFIGDAMEEDIDKLCNLAGKLGVQGIKAFVFQEGRDPLAERAFREIARLSGGAFLRLNSGSAKELAELLSAVAAYATGGRQSLQLQKGKASQALLRQLKD